MNSILAKTIDINYMGKEIHFNIGDIDNLSNVKEILVNDGTDINEKPYFIIYVTDDCNKNCSYCFNKKNYSSINKGLNYNIEELISFLKNYKSFSIRFFGGEPLLRFDIIKKIIQQIKESNLDSTYDIFTNATILNSEIINFIKENNIDIYVSIPGSFNEFKDYSLIKNNINKLIDNGINVKGRMVWQPSSDLSLKQIIERIFESKIQVISFTIAWGNTDINNITLIKKDISELTLWYINNIKNRNYAYIGVHPIIGYISLWLSGKYNYDACGAGKSVVSISTEGELFPCHCFTKNTNFLSGNIFDNKWEKLFQNENHCMYNECKNCNFSLFCKAKCFANNYFVTGEINNIDKYRCTIEYEIIKSSIYILTELQKNKKDYNLFKRIIKMGVNKYVNNK